MFLYIRPLAKYRHGSHPTIKKAFLSIFYCLNQKYPQGRTMTVSNFCF